MAGATVRLIALGTEGFLKESVTDAEGRFELSGLPYDEYAIEIETAAGEKIRGINALPVTKDEPVEIVLQVSDRVRSETSVLNQPDYFVGVVKREPKRWRRFWREFAIFWGAAVVTGVAAEE
jgi:hypothetical protein